MTTSTRERKRKREARYSKGYDKRGWLDWLSAPHEEKHIHQLLHYPAPLFYYHPLKRADVYYDPEEPYEKPILRRHFDFFGKRQCPEHYLPREAIFNLIMYEDTARIYELTGMGGLLGYSPNKQPFEWLCGLDELE